MWGLSSKIGISIAAALTLAACAGTVPPSGPVASGKSSESSTRRPLPAFDDAFVITDADGTRHRMRTDDLMGLAAIDLAQMFGKPSLQRSERPAEIIQYSANRCVLLVFLYPNEAAAPERQAQEMALVTYAETLTRDLKSDPVPSTECLETLLRQARTQPAQS
jgi:hypothetical protein